MKGFTWGKSLEHVNILEKPSVTLVVITYMNEVIL